MQCFLLQIRWFLCPLFCCCYFTFLSSFLLYAIDSFRIQNSAFCIVLDAFDYTKKKSYIRFKVRNRMILLRVFFFYNSRLTTPFCNVYFAIQQWKGTWNKSIIHMQCMFYVCRQESIFTNFFFNGRPTKKNTHTQIYFPFLPEQKTALLQCLARYAATHILIRCYCVSSLIPLIMFFLFYLYPSLLSKWDALLQFFFSLFIAQDLKLSDRKKKIYIK